MKTSKRSAAYPSYTIDYCLEICTTIYKNYGTGHRASREELADILGISVGNLTQKVSAAVQYSLLDLKSREGYCVDPLFVQWYRPINEEQRKEALIQAFRSPTLYANLIEAFENSIVPPIKPLASILLQRHNISESACEKAADVFLENANNIGVLDKENRLVFGRNMEVEAEEVFEDYIETDENDESGTKTNVPQIIKPNGSNHKHSSSMHDNPGDKNGIVINVLLNDRRTAQVILPTDVNSKDCDTIKDWIDMIRKSFN